MNCSPKEAASKIPGEPSGPSLPINLLDLPDLRSVQGCLPCVWAQGNARAPVARHRGTKRPRFTVGSVVARRLFDVETVRP
jgi:hypothetical protein